MGSNPIAPTIYFERHNNMTLAQIGQFRLQTIIKFDKSHFHLNRLAEAFKEQPVSDGLAIEIKQGEDNYLVIAFLYPCSDSCDLKTVGDRLFTYVRTEDDLSTIRMLYEYGCHRVVQARQESQN